MSLNFLIKAKKSLGQNFLLNEDIADRIAYDARIPNNNILLEVGVGTGALTIALLNAYKPNIFIGIEKDSSLLKRFAENMENFGFVSQEVFSFHDGYFVDAYLFSNNKTSLYVLHQDAVEIDYRKLIDEIYHLADHLSQGRAPISIFGNLPYNIATKLIMNWLGKPELKEIDFITVMIQKEVAKRMLAKANEKEYSSLSVVTQLYSRPHILFDVDPSAFYPRPKVFSSVIQFGLIKEALPLHDEKKLVEELAYNLFLFRRKCIQNTLPKYLGTHCNISTKGIQNIFTEISSIIDLRERAENLTIENLIKIASIIREYRSLK